jgi:hypothetical protein
MVLKRIKLRTLIQTPLQQLRGDIGSITELTNLLIYLFIAISIFGDNVARISII